MDKKEWLFENKSDLTMLVLKKQMQKWFKVAINQVALLEAKTQLCVLL